MKVPSIFVPSSERTPSNVALTLAIDSDKLAPSTSTSSTGMGALSSSTEKKVAAKLPSSATVAWRRISHPTPSSAPVQLPAKRSAAALASASGSGS